MRRTRNNSPKVCRRRRAAFTLVELLVVSVLMIGVTLMTAQLWRFFSVEMKDLTARARVAQELRLALASIVEDTGAAVGAVPVEANRILLCRDSGACPNGQPDWAEPDILVEYYLADGQLIRHDQSTGTQITIAGDVSAFTVENVTESVVRMVIQIQRPDLTRSVTLMWSSP